MNLCPPLECGPHYLKLNLPPCEPSHPTSHPHPHHPHPHLCRTGLWFPRKFLIIPKNQVVEGSPNFTLDVSPVAPGFRACGYLGQMCLLNFSLLSSYTLPPSILRRAKSQEAALPVTQIPFPAVCFQSVQKASSLLLISASLYRRILPAALFPQSPVHAVPSS